MKAASVAYSIYSINKKTWGWNKHVSTNKNTELSNETLIKRFGIVRFFYLSCFVIKKLFDFSKEQFRANVVSEAAHRTPLERTLAERKSIPHLAKKFFLLLPLSFFNMCSISADNMLLFFNQFDWRLPCLVHKPLMLSHLASAWPFSFLTKRYRYVEVLLHLEESIKGDP